MDPIAEEESKQKAAEIERSIIKRYRKSIWRPFLQAIDHYELIQAGDKIAVCISGGKDSMLLAKLFQELKKHRDNRLELVFLLMNPGYQERDLTIALNNAKLLGIPLTVFETDIFKVIAHEDKNPCYLCARMRRGSLYRKAKELGCNKIALGHHFDDVVETILMGMFYGGQIETMMPKLRSRNFPDMELIRPLYLVKEEHIKLWRDYNQLYFIKCACKVTEGCSDSGGVKHSKREEMKELLQRLRETSDVIERNIFSSVQNVNLNKIIGYKKDGEGHNFLEDYN